MITDNVTDLLSFVSNIGLDNWHTQSGTNCIVLSIRACIYLYYAIVLCEVSKYLVQYPLVVCAVPVWWRVSSAPLTTTRKNNTINNHRKNLQIIISSHESCNSHLAAAPTGNHRNMAMGVSVYIQHRALFPYL